MGWRGGEGSGDGGARDALPVRHRLLSSGQRRPLRWRGRRVRPHLPRLRRHVPYDQNLHGRVDGDRDGTRVHDVGAHERAVRRTAAVETGSRRVTGPCVTTRAGPRRPPAGRDVWMFDACLPPRRMPPRAFCHGGGDDGALAGTSAGGRSVRVGAGTRGAPGTPLTLDLGGGYRPSRGSEPVGGASLRGCSTRDARTWIEGAGARWRRRRIPPLGFRASGGSVRVARCSAVLGGSRWLCGGVPPSGRFGCSRCA